jgi:hypothetical protein
MNRVFRILFAVALLLASSAPLAAAARAVELSERLRALQKKATALSESGAYREALQASEETLAETIAKIIGTEIADMAKTTADKQPRCLGRAARKHGQKGNYPASTRN